MRSFFALVVFFFIFGSTACSSGEQAVADIKNKTSTSDVKKLNISAEDQFIIDSYKTRINTVDLSDTEVFKKVLKDSLVEINKIKNDYEREKLQLSIYSSLEMYEEAYELNSKMLKDSFGYARLMSQCELSYYAKRPQKEYEACYAELASAFEKELIKTPKTDPEYIYGEWWYLLSMYKSGHEEYEVKLKEMLNSIKDKEVKYQLESSYELAQEQKQSYVSK